MKKNLNENLVVMDKFIFDNLVALAVCSPDYDDRSMLKKALKHVCRFNPLFPKPDILIPVEQNRIKKLRTDKHKVNRLIRTHRDKTVYVNSQPVKLIGPAIGIEPDKDKVCVEGYFDPPRKFWILNWFDDVIKPKELLRVNIHIDDIKLEGSGFSTSVCESFELTLTGICKKCGNKEGDLCRK